MIDSFERLPIGKYMDICSVIEQEGLTEIDRQAEIIAILCDTDADSVISLPILEYKALAAKTRFLEQDIPDSPSRMAKSYKIGGFELIPTTDIRKMTAQQYIDFQTMTALGRDKLVEILSCFLLPKGCAYGEGYDILDVQKAIRECLPVTDVSCLSAFFFKRFHESIKASLIFSMLMARGLPRKERKEMKARIRQIRREMDSHGDGVGLQPLMQ